MLVALALVRVLRPVRLPALQGGAVQGGLLAALGAGGARAGRCCRDRRVWREGVSAREREGSIALIP